MNSPFCTWVTAKGFRRPLRSVKKCGLESRTTVYTVMAALAYHPPDCTVILSVSKLKQLLRKPQKERQAFSPIVWIGPPCPLPTGECVPPFGTGGGGHLLAGEGVGGLNSDEGTETVVYKNKNKNKKKNIYLSFPLHI